MKSNTIKYLLAVTIYGTIGLLLHYVNASSEFVVLCRGVMGSIFILLVMLVKREKMNLFSIKSNLKLLILSGICLGLNWVFLFAGYKRALALTSLCNYTAPIFVCVITSIMYKERLNNKVIVCIITSFIGIVLISGIFNDSGLDLYCLILGLLAAFGFVGLVLMNRKFRNIKPLDKTVIQLAISALTVLPYVIFNNGFPKILDKTSLIIILILGIIHTGVAYILYFSSIDTLEVGKVAILGYIEPALNVIIGILILKEEASIFSVLGAILILFSAIRSELVSYKN